MRNIVSLSFVLLLSLISTSQSRYFDLSSLLQPILQPGFEHIGSVDRNSNIKKAMSFGKHHNNKNSENGNGRKNANLRAIQELVQNSYETQENLYKAIGIPQQIIMTKILPIHTFALRQLYLYFPKKRTHKKDLMASMYQLKQMIQFVIKNYLEDVSSIVVGNNNAIAGSHIYMQGDNHQIIGKQDFIFNPNHSDKMIKGCNIVRIGSFDIDLDLIHTIKTHPQIAIKYLGPPK